MAASAIAEHHFWVSGSNGNLRALSVTILLYNIIMLYIMLSCYITMGFSVKNFLHGI